MSRRAQAAVVVALATVGLVCWLAAAPALAHRSGCHGAHSCPSDHHSYIWYDSSGKAWDCAEPGAREVSAQDTTRIVYAGLVYLCHAYGSSAGGASSGGSSNRGSGAASCGLERWTVKTLQDRPTLRRVKKTTIAYLVTRPNPGNLPSFRLPFERNVFSVSAAVVLVRKEVDSDYHLVLRDPAGRTMIAESPLPSCAPRATAARRAQMATVRAAVRLCARAVVTGVAFFDFQHGQTGVAPNAIELHPILAFRCLA